jgi:hypothetical protein
MYMTSDTSGGSLNLCIQPLDEPISCFRQYYHDSRVASGKIGNDVIPIASRDLLVRGGIHCFFP